MCKNEQIEPHLTSDFFQKWHISRVNDSPRTLRKKFSVWKQLTSLMCRVGCHCFIPQMPLNLKSDFTPYIFTQEQITAIFKSCDTLVLQRHNTNSSLFAIPALLRILYSTGLRISEALNLKNEDVDLKKHVIKITQTKNGCARIVPICIELEEVLRQYLKYRDKLPVKNVSLPKSLFFVKNNGTIISNYSVGYYFRGLLKELGISPIGTGNGPRIHDLRHTFAVHALAKLAKSGENIYSIIVALSNCLGHKSIKSTDMYVRLTSTMYPEIEKLLSSLNVELYK